MPSAKPTVGVSDLGTRFPEIAAEADGWDPITVRAGCPVEMNWKCNRGHRWRSRVSARTSQGSGCPFCSGHKVWKGYNDLATTHPDLAKEAEGWDPSTLSKGSRKRVTWKCHLGHTWELSISNRTSGLMHSGCPYCSGRKLLRGFNDLGTLFPSIAAEADGWDPCSIGKGHDQKKRWKCKLDHKWNASPNNRTNRGSGCPICSGNTILSGYNDLHTKCPHIAVEADGWDPQLISAYSNLKKNWRCKLGHQWVAVVYSRTQQETGCPYCSNRKTMEGFNDLKTLYPGIAAEAFGWDPQQVAPGSNQKKRWKCIEGHIWEARIGHRVPPTNSGCPTCAEYGFSPDKQAWFYLMSRPGEQQFGITNDFSTRMKTHESKGWTLL